MPDTEMEMQHVKKIVSSVRNALEFLTVQGARNASIVVACCNDLDKLVAELEKEKKEVQVNGNHD